MLIFYVYTVSIDSFAMLFSLFSDKKEVVEELRVTFQVEVLQRFLVPASKEAKKNLCFIQPWPLLLHMKRALFFTKLEYTGLHGAPRKSLSFSRSLHAPYLKVVEALQFKNLPSSVITNSLKG